MSRKAVGGKVVRAYIPQTLADAWENGSDEFKMKIVQDAEKEAKQKTEQKEKQEQYIAEQQKVLEKAWATINRLDEEIEKLKEEKASEKEACFELYYSKCSEIEKLEKEVQELKTLREENKPLNTWADEI